MIIFYFTKTLQTFTVLPVIMQLGHVRFVKSRAVKGRNHIDGIKIVGQFKNGGRDISIPI
jgi:hypothetical protein